MIAFVLSSFFALADAPALYVNGVRADALRNYEFRDVNVRIDEKGDVWIDAPQYKVEAIPPSGSSGRSGTTSVAGQIPTGRYWLVTEDNGSQGHDIEVLINGALIQRIHSGDAQLILDVGKYLRPGLNTILFNALPASRFDGGVLNIYVGTGNNQSGTVVLDAPMVTFSRRSSDSISGASRSYQIEVP